MTQQDALVIIRRFYPSDNDLRSTLLKHSFQVADKSLKIAENCGIQIDKEFVYCGALLHDIGIYRCNANSIFCFGSEPYLRHGIIGAEILRNLGIEFESFARICERHTGSGLTKENIIAQNLPLPAQDFLPETIEEKLICLADKFFSKSGNMQEKTVEKIRASFAKFSPDAIKRFENLCTEFKIRWQ